MKLADVSTYAHRLEQIGPQWWGAIAGAAAAGAVVVPSHRLLAATAAAAAIAWLALGRPMPGGACCDECAHGQPCAGGAAPSAAATDSAPLGISLSNLNGGGCGSCG